MIPILASGTLLNERYTITKVLGSGGMGHVYLAFDEQEEHNVAIKQTHLVEPSQIKDFIREAKLLGKLDHPNIPKVTDRFEVNSQPFMVMTHITGKNLSERLREKMTADNQPFPVETVLRWADSLLDTLTFLHKRTPPVIHRDIKPANLKESRAGVLYLLDFGLAKGYLTEYSQPIKSVDRQTPGYAPPEQSDGSGTDERSDLYSVGATMYQLLTGKGLPHAMLRVMALVARKPDCLAPLASVAPDVPSRVVAVIEKALSLAPDDRPSSAAEMRSMLFEAVGGKPFPVNSANEADTVSAEIPERKPEIIVVDPAPVIAVVDGLPETITNAFGMEFMLIRPGKFWMGSTDEEVRQAFENNKKYNPDAKLEWYTREQPRREVEITKPFWMAKYQMTQKQWREAVTGLRKIDLELNVSPSRFEGDDLPVENVSWIDCAELITRLNESGEEYGYDFPTEAEWEFACRAGTTTVFSFGNVILASQANYNGGYPYGNGPEGEYRKRTTPVGSFPANDFGLSDMHGNVWEWCQDRWHENYKGAPTHGSGWENGGSEERVLRGGSWHSKAKRCRSGFRNKNAPTHRDDFVGFRCVIRSART